MRRKPPGPQGRTNKPGPGAPKHAAGGPRGAGRSFAAEPAEAGRGAKPEPGAARAGATRLPSPASAHGAGRSQGRGAKPESGAPGTGANRLPSPAAVTPRGAGRSQGRQARAEPGAPHAGGARAPEGAEAPPRPGAGAGSGAYWLYGLHAVGAALANPARRPRRLLVTEEAQASLGARLGGPWRLTPERAERNRFATFLPEDAVHQGAALLVEPLEPVALDLAIAASGGPVLLLDQVTDPRNVGAALRSAAAFGAAAVVLQDRHAPPETGALARAASGALDLVPVVREVNLSRAILALQRAGFWVIGLAGEAPRMLAEAAPRDRRVALVLGAEDTGLRRLQREHCDELARLPMAPGVESLNVAAAAAVALYELMR